MKKRLTESHFFPAKLGMNQFPAKLGISQFPGGGGGLGLLVLHDLFAQFPAKLEISQFPAKLGIAQFSAKLREFRRRWRWSWRWDRAGTGKLKKRSTPSEGSSPSSQTAN